jgi:hypothetical protein
LRNIKLQPLSVIFTEESDDRRPDYGRQCQGIFGDRYELFAELFSLHKPSGNSKKQAVQKQGFVVEVLLFPSLRFLKKKPC